jgi:hypothetical protein
MTSPVVHLKRSSSLCPTSPSASSSAVAPHVDLSSMRSQLTTTAPADSASANSSRNKDAILGTVVVSLREKASLSKARST